MTDSAEERALVLGQYIAEEGATVRAAAQKFGVSKSTVHKDVTGKLRRLNPALYRQVREILDRNKRERHIRGGMATKQKYAKSFEQKRMINCAL
ncbi:MAG: sporulation transcriptional regulator SpoIIID [Ruminococcus sp.]|nr:sporulation transcriptional regulator SpoIIID [Ruminococcus sp.]